MNGSAINLSSLPDLMILGSGRSGTTWLGKLFDSHPDVLYRHEPDIVLPTDTIPFLPAASDYPAHSALARNYLESLVHVRAPKTVMHRPQFRKSYRSRFAHHTHRFIGLAIGSAEKLRVPVIRTLPIPDFIQSNSQRPFTVLKSVSSLNRGALFATAHPSLKIIHLIRNPFAVIASTLNAMSTGRFENSIFLKSAFSLPTADQYPITFNDVVARPPEAQLAYCWMAFNDNAALDTDNTDTVRNISYEDLCNELEAVLPALFTFAGLAMHPATSNFIQALNSAGSTNAGFYDILRPPKASLNKWKTSLSADAIRNIESIVRHTLSEPVRKAIP